tara:strand:- start:249 stop:368 length:120 start_codon:yes stop_codon:yes gene_type:complete
LSISQEIIHRRINELADIEANAAWVGGYGEKEVVYQRKK